MYIFTFVRPFHIYRHVCTFYIKQIFLTVVSGFILVTVFTFNVLNSYPAFCFGVGDMVYMFFLALIIIRRNFDKVSHFAGRTVRIAKPEATSDDLSLCFVSGLPAVYDKSHLTTLHVDTSSRYTST